MHALDAEDRLALLHLHSRCCVHFGPATPLVSPPLNLLHLTKRLCRTCARALLVVWEYILF